MTNLREVAAFLLGEGELDGVGFGDPHQTERGNYWWRKHLRAALAQQDHLAGMRKMVAQPEPEPVAWKDAPSKIYLQVCNENDCDQPFDSHIEVSWCQDKINDSDVAYVRADTAPPQREWQGLTDEEIENFVQAVWPREATPTDYIRAIEAKLKEKNA